MIGVSCQGTTHFLREKPWGQGWFRVSFRVSFYFERSLGPGFEVGKSKKRGEIGKILASEASRALVWGGEMGGATLSLPRLPLADFVRTRRFSLLFPPMRSLVPGYFYHIPEFCFVLFRLQFSLSHTSAVRGQIRGVNIGRVRG